MNYLTRCKPLLGTYVEILVGADTDDDYLIEQSERAFAAISKVHDTMSFHCPNSELSRLNQLAAADLGAANKEIELSIELGLVLDYVSRLNAATDGLFDPTVASELMSNAWLPSLGIELPLAGRWSDVQLNGRFIRFNRKLMLDLGGIAKGFAVDQAIQSLDCGVQAVVNAGGDLRMTHWQSEEVGIQLGPGRVKPLEMSAPALATSAHYYNDQSSVIVDPLEGRFVQTKQVVSVFADSCLIADALTKVVWLLSSEDSHDRLSVVLKHFGAHCVLSNTDIGMCSA